jgi:glycosyltransferase involved in cell wall biosynthesis
MDPLKLYEYLAAGLPVVSTVASPNPALSGEVRTARGAEAFALALREELAADGPERRAARRRAVAGETWAARADRVLTVLDEALRARSAARP